MITYNIKDMKKNEFGYHVDGMWKCDCGSLNSAYNTICSKCKKNK